MTSDHSVDSSNLSDCKALTPVIALLWDTFGTLLRSNGGSLEQSAGQRVIVPGASNERGIRNGEWAAIRENLELILNGDPAGVPLFT